MSQFMNLFHGPLYGVLLWSQWSRLIEALSNNSDGAWYVYYVGEPVPTSPLPAAGFQQFLVEVNHLLRQDHDEDYLGIVYVDDIDDPSFLKIYDPNNLGASCGSSGRQVLPGWILSRVPPVDLNAEFPNPGGRRRWWQRLLAGFTTPAEANS